MTVLIDIAVEADAWEAVEDLDAVVNRAVAAAWEEAGERESAELSVLFCDDETIRALNAQWRGKDKPTNVLSFPAAGRPLPGAPRLLGDIAIAFETTRHEAEQEGKSLVAHVTHLLVHGTLHLLGQDHETPAEGEAMEAAERRALARLGIGDPYAETDLMTTGAR